MTEHSDAEFTPQERAQLRNLLAQMTLPEESEELGDDGGEVILMPGGHEVLECTGRPALILVSREAGCGDHHPEGAGLSGTLYVQLEDIWLLLGTSG